MGYESKKKRRKAWFSRSTVEIMAGAESAKIKHSVMVVGVPKEYVGDRLIPWSPLSKVNPDDKKGRPQNWNDILSALGQIKFGKVYP